MTFGRFVYKNAIRNKRRTFLTVCSIAFSLFLLVTLQTILNLLLNPTTSDQTALRVAVRRSTSLADQMPLAYEKDLEKVDNVSMILPLQWFGGQYIEPKNFFANFGTDPDRLWDMFPEYTISDEAKKTFSSRQDSAVCGQQLADKFDWKVGDRITLQGTIFPADLEFELVGTFRSEVQESSFYFDFDYLNQALGEPNTIGTFWLMAANQEAVPQIIEDVDTMFANSPAETKSETEKAFMLGFVSMLGNVKMIIGSIAGVVVFTMLLVVASTMAMTIRERMKEVAILKSIGYTRGVVLILILGEALLLGLIGTAMGCASAYVMRYVDVQTYTQGFIEKFEVPIRVYLTALAVGVGVAAFSGLIPALQASRMSITEAMRRLE